MDLVGYLLDALPDDERAAVEAALQGDPALRAKVQTLRATLRPLAIDEDLDPPPGLADRTIAAARNPAFTVARTTDWSATSPRIRFLDLVVVASVLLLAAIIILPAIASLRGEEGRLACADNFRQYYASLANYCSVENGQYPTGGPSGSLNNAGSVALILHVQGFLPQVRVLACPMADSAVVFVPKLAEYLAQPTDSALRRIYRRDMGGSYGYALGHQSGGEYHAPQLQGDHSPIASDRPARAHEDLEPGNSPNHGRLGQNVLFADGHVQFLSSPYYGHDNYFRNAAGRIGAGLNEFDACIGVSEATPFP